MKNMPILEILLFLAVAFFIGRSLTIENRHKKKGPFITVRVFSNVAIFNIVLIIFILISSFITFNSATKYSINNVMNLYILLPVIFIIYQTVLSLKFTLCQDGICYIGQFIDYKYIKSVQISKSKNKYNIVIFTQKSTLTFKVSENNKFLIEEAFKKYKIKLSKIN